jgi:hypothetical protein
MPELQRFSNGTIDYVCSGSYGIVLQMDADESTVLSTQTCGIKSILVKIVSIDKPLTFDNEIETEEGIEKEVIEIEPTSVDEFKKEVKLQELIRKKSVTNFNCSIIPSILYADVYTQEELMATFPKIKDSIVTTGKVGLIFMEHILDQTGRTARNLGSYYHYEAYKYYTQQMYFPMARRLLIMLAQLGYLHNDFHTGNILASGASVIIIDVGRVTPITREDYELFSGYFQTYASGGSPVELLTFLHGKRIPIVAPEGKEEHYLPAQWLRQNQIDTYVPGIDPTVVIAPENIITRTLILSEEQKTRCVTAKVPYIERDAAARVTAEMDARDARDARETAAKEKLANETPEEKTLREEQDAEKLRRLDPNYYPY